MLDTPGRVYLICFERPYKHARHYMGWTARSIEERIAEHMTGKGSRLMAAVVNAGISWEVVKVWEGATLRDELRWKSGSAGRKCPIHGGRK
jgi:predicted GIY-YIG superfamily endonuclease